MTIDDMLDELEAAIFKLQSGNGQHTGTAPAPASAVPAPNGNGTRASALRAQMDRSGVTSFDFNSIYGVAPSEIEAWLRGAEPIPGWVPASVRVLGMIAPSSRRRLRTNPQQETKPPNKHPYSRIEEL